VTESYLQGIANQVSGLDLTKWTADRNDATLAAKVTSDQQQAVQAGFSGTPSFLLNKTGSPLKAFNYTSLTDPSGFESAIDKLLA
jgi:protein-disulfide isomerase